MLDDHMEIIRGHLGNDGFCRHGLGAFHHAHACAAADVLQDAELAIADYLKSESGSEVGLDHLRTYGVLQAAYLQQEAARTFREAFSLASEEWPEAMRALRELRNRTTGHPASTPKGTAHPPATFMARCTMSSRSLQVFQIEADGTWHSSSVDVRAMLKAHGDALCGWMEELVQELRRREEVRREDIVARGSVSALMHPSWRWLLSKIHEASCAPDGALAATVAQPSVPLLLEVLDEIERGLVERQIDPPHSWDVETARATLNRLAELLPRDASGVNVQIDIAAFATLAEQHLNAIKYFLGETLMLR